MQKIKKKRLFKIMNDKWLPILGIPFVGIMTALTFNKFSFDVLLSEGFRNLILSITTTITIWLGIRAIVIHLWERYPWEKNPIKHLIYEIVLVTFYTLLVGYINYAIARYTNFVTLEEDMNMGVSVFITLLITFFITSLHEAWFFFNQWNISLLKAQMLEKENVISQYETLKTQINPHFLFNTLNTLTTLIEENPPKAVEYVGQTSDFLRSILGLKDKEIISLSQEKQIIDTFYRLQRERFGENLKLRIRLSEKSLSKNIPPLAIQMLVENAIKHNIISSEFPLTVTIEDCDATMICVSNNLQRKKQPGPSSGIGLQNIRNRYSFLSEYPVSITETDTHFEVKLPLLDA